MDAAPLRHGNARRDRIEWIFARTHSWANIGEIAHDVSGHIIMPSVIAALNCNDVFPARMCTSDPYGVIGRLRPSVRNLQLLYTRNSPTNKFSQFAFPVGRARSH